MITRRKTRQITLGTLKVGGDAPLTVQSMTKTDTRDVQATLLEIWALEAAGCAYAMRCRYGKRPKLGRSSGRSGSRWSPTSLQLKLALIALEQGVDGCD
jgi:hypothetical protein